MSNQPLSRRAFIDRRALGSAGVVAGRIPPPSLLAAPAWANGARPQMPSWYEPVIRVWIAAFRQEFRHLFTIIDAQGLALYITTDIFSYIAALRQRLGSSAHKTNVF